MATDTEWCKTSNILTVVTSAKDA
uniref:Uncharacterized protein n=1 Tax=Arundo donax TaxID=35708 RepID=A0A0A9HMX3_ARUDO